MIAQPANATVGHTPPNPVVTALPRCNFAGYCNFCGTQGCASPDCVAIYLDTWWAACEICGDGLGLNCICTYGVVQVGSAHQGAVQPR